MNFISVNCVFIMKYPGYINICVPKLKRILTFSSASVYAMTSLPSTADILLSDAPFSLIEKTFVTYFF